MLSSQVGRLSPTDRLALIHAAENGQPFWVEFQDGTFLGVNITAEPHLLVEEREGLWSCGRVSCSR